MYIATKPDSSRTNRFEQCAMVLYYPIPTLGQLESTLNKFIVDKIQPWASKGSILLYDNYFFTTLT